eukprot:444474_1
MASRYLKIKILMVGDSGVGKSNIMTRFASNEYEDPKYLTIGIDFRIKTLEIDDIKVKFQIWDTSGLDKYATNTIRSSNCRGAQAFMIVYSTRDITSFHGVKDFLPEIEWHGKDKTINMLLGNQADNHHFQEREVTTAEAEQFADDTDLCFMEVSAKTGMNVDKAFTFVARQLVQQQKIRNILEESNFDIKQQEFDRWRLKYPKMKYTEHSLLDDVVDGYIGEYNKKSVTKLLKIQLKYNHKKRQQFYYILLTKLNIFEHKKRPQVLLTNPKHIKHQLEQFDQKNFIKILTVIAFNVDPNVDLDEIEQIVRQKQLDGNVFVKEATQYRASNKFTKLFATTKNYNKHAWNQIFSRLKEWNLFENPFPIPGSVQYGEIHYDDIRNILEESKFDIEEHEFNMLQSELEAGHYTQNKLLLDVINGYIGEYKNDKKSLAKILEKKLKYSAQKRKRFYYILLKKLIKQ